MNLDMVLRIQLVLCVLLIYHDKQSAQISQMRDEHNLYVIMDSCILFSIFHDNIYIYIYMNKKPVCMCCAVKIKQKTQRLFDEFSYFFS